jgi:hypothetical protein
MTKTLASASISSSIAAFSASRTVNSCCELKRRVAQCGTLRI